MSEGLNNAQNSNSPIWEAEKGFKKKLPRSKRVNVLIQKIENIVNGEILGEETRGRPGNWSLPIEMKNKITTIKEVTFTNNRARKMLRNLNMKLICFCVKDDDCMQKWQRSINNIIDAFEIPRMKQKLTEDDV